MTYYLTDALGRYVTRFDAAAVDMAALAVSECWLLILSPTPWIDCASAA